MERRSFLIALTGAAGAALAASAMPALALPPVAPVPVLPEHPVEELTAAIATEDDLASANIEDIYWRRRRYYRRRFYYRPRYRYYRPRYRYYRPRYRRCRIYRTYGGYVRRCY